MVEAVGVKYISGAVPFVQIGNRRGLTKTQLVERPELAAFVKRFPASFEVSFNLDVVFFIEPEQQP